ncbi:MAG TPA: hypothetical protein VN836_05825 [Verrucomicrobiae bacterium]|nr:hypothetical protein [Verrucomicrobiae bacterium]
MNHRVRRQGEDLGFFSLEELRRRRETGELTGNEYVQAEGRSDWQPLDLVLQQGYRVVPPPLPPASSKSGPSPRVIWLIVGGVVIFLAVGVTLFTVFVINFQRGFQAAVNQGRVQHGLNESSREGVTAASEPITWTTNTLTERDAQKRAREFRIRQWLDGYAKRGRHNPATDAAVEQLIRVWIDRNFGGPEATNTLSVEAESDRLARNPDCTDPLALTVVADNSLNYFEIVHRFERALAAYPGTGHHAYPEFYGSIRLIIQLGDNSPRVGALNMSALKLLAECFADGSFKPGDQQEIAEIFVNEWGSDFFSRNANSVCRIIHQAGPSYQWLALTLDGEREIRTAWDVRGHGWANTVSEEGWQGYRDHLAKSRQHLTQAWNLQPGFPMAPRLMITVALGDSDEMRTWFDRALLAQVDYPGAWEEMRWGLRPRWHGSEAAMLALGRAAIKTGRFDTDVPYEFFDCVADVESEMELPPGRHIYGRTDIWPDIQKMYQGYIGASARSHWNRLDEWRTSYAVVACFAGKYDVAAEQLKALNWKPVPEHLRDWGVGLSLMPLEVAARTGSLGAKISAAESARNTGDFTFALKQYGALAAASGADARTREFVQLRLAQLAVAQRLRDGKWADWLPANDHDPNWVFSFGQARRLADGALEAESSLKGHMLFSTVPAGTNFEVRGRLEAVRSANTNFQAGLVMGMPDFNGVHDNWYGFRLKRNSDEGDVVSFSLGWSGEQVLQHVKLNDVTNSFDLIFKNGRVTAFVNGVEVFHQATPPDGVEVSDNGYLVGLGAFDGNHTVVRYRDVQVRQLH